MTYNVNVMNAKCNPLILLSKLSWLVFKAFCIIKTNMSLSYVFLCQKVISCEDKLPDLIFDIMMIFYIHVPTSDSSVCSFLFFVVVKNYNNFYLSTTFTSSKNNSNITFRKHIIVQN